MERRKLFSMLKSRATRPIAILASVFVLSAAAIAQADRDMPPLSVLRRNVGVVSRIAGKTIILPAGETHHELVTGDFDADGVQDTGTFDATSRLFTIRRSADGSTLAVSIQDGKGKAAIAAADYDGDKRTDPAVWRSGTWQILLSSRGYAADFAVFGIMGDVPVPADFDGDSRADLAVFRPSENRWYVRNSGNGHVRTFDLGVAGTDLLLPADYTGDGKADVAVYRGGVWHLIDSETGEHESFQFGFDDGRPVPGDFNRDGQVDFALFRKGTWYVYDGSGLFSYKFGGEEDVALGMVPVKAGVPRL
jgi:hypothetical protein